MSIPPISPVGNNTIDFSSLPDEIKLNVFEFFSIEEFINDCTVYVTKMGRAFLNQDEKMIEMLVKKKG